MIGYFLSPYVAEEVQGRVKRTLAFDKATPEIEAANGYWSEFEVPGNYAVVRCRAPKALIRKLSRSFQEIDPPGHTLDHLVADVLDDAGADAMRGHAYDLMARAEKEGHVTVTGLPWQEAARVLCVCGRHGFGLDRISTGTFPTRGVLDNFNRAAIGTNWTAWPGGGAALAISGSTVLVGAAANGEGYWNVATYGPDSEVYLDFVTMPAVNNFIAMHLRVTSPGGSNSSYELNFKTVSGAANDQQQISRYNAGAQTVLGATNTTEYAAGNSIGLEAIGAVLTAYKKTGGSWSATFTRTDASPLIQAGNLSVYIQETTTQLDNFGGGNITYAPRSIVVVDSAVDRSASW